MKKKLLFFVEAMGGGVFTYIVDLSNELSSKYDVYVAYGVREQTPYHYKNYFNKNVKLIYMKNFVRSISFSKDLKAFREMKEVAAKVDPDIIHLHSSKAGVLGRLAFNYSKKPIFYTPHGYSFLMSSVAFTKRITYKVIEKLCSFGKSVTIACSQGEYEEACKLSSRVELVNNGINTQELDRYRLDNIEPIVDVVTLGRITYQKNPTLFNEIAEQLPNLKFRWIGDGELRNKLTAPNIEVTGWLDRKEALKEIQEAKIFILPSRWEGLPISLLEAMYFGKICVVSDVVGNRDVVNNSVNGFICDSIDSYVSVIKKLLSSSVLDTSIRNNALSDICEEYNTISMAKKYDELYLKYM